MDVDTVKEFLLESMPMPSGCKLLAEAGYPDSLEGKGVIVRRNLRVDVSDRLPSGVQPLDKLDEDAPDRSVYTKLVRDLTNDLLEILTSVSGKEGDDFRLSGRREEDTNIYYSSEMIVTTRVEFEKQVNSKTYFYLDFTAVVLG